jgi:hypothetical protein
MKRVVIMNWKERTKDPFEIFSNLKLLCESYPIYNYNTLNNYLSKNKMAYENKDVRIERKVVNTSAIPIRKMAMVAKRVKRTEQELLAHPPSGRKTRCSDQNAIPGIEERTTDG